MTRKMDLKSNATKITVLMCKIARSAGELMLEGFRLGVDSVEKADKSIVTKYDQKINHMVIEAIQSQFPSHSIIGEEESVPSQSEYAWICDPIDGTVPFSRGLPVSVFSLALVKKGRVEYGVVYHPFNDRLYFAQLGKARV